MSNRNDLNFQLDIVTDVAECADKAKKTSVYFGISEGLYCWVLSTYIRDDVIVPKNKLPNRYYCLEILSSLRSVSQGPSEEVF